MSRYKNSQRFMTGAAVLILAFAAFGWWTMFSRGFNGFVMAQHLSYTLFGIAILVTTLSKQRTLRVRIIQLIAGAAILLLSGYRWSWAVEGRCSSSGILMTAVLTLFGVTLLLSRVNQPVVSEN